MKAVTLRLFALIAALAAAPVGRADDVDAQWIWSPAQTRNEIPVGDCYFRRTFETYDVEAAQVQITADNRFELFVNGKAAASGVDWRQMQVLDVTKLFKNGRNVIAIKATNSDAGAAGLVARVLVKQRSGAFEGFSTDNRWRTSVKEFADWQQPQFSDAAWVPAVSYGAFGDALPWGNEMVVAGEGARFVIDKEFEVERLMRDNEVGSLIAMTFDAAGNIIASQEGGHLIRITDSDGNGILDKATTYCDKIDTAQGLLALGSRVYAVGGGPDGPGLYQLRDADRDGAADEVKKLVGFRGSHGEHGPHAVRLGPDGLLYVMIGNFARADAAPTPRSPYRTWYEGDLVPKYEDAGGHEVGIPAPGGTIFRTDANGSFVEFVAGGLRNAYDMAFSPTGELFTDDSDMEWDKGAPWYRPTRVSHVIAGAEMGWRAGWSKWPEYYLDSLPAAINVGAGSPTGLEFYDHDAFPEKYRGAMFGCDWATGRIHAFTFHREGATFTAKEEVFLRGMPMNATDCAVGPDGALYFCTGGRGTDGGVYRVRWSQAKDQKLVNRGTGIDVALRQPQFDADWARAKIATVRQQLGAGWGDELAAAALDPNRPVHERLRAVDVMVCFGPRPTDGVLQKLAAVPLAEIRAKAAGVMFASDDAATRTALTQLLKDKDALVRRVACESFARRGPLPDAAIVFPLLGDQDRFVAFAARKLIELLPVDTWGSLVLKERDPHAFSGAAVALVNIERKTETSQAVIKKAQKLLAAEQAAAKREAGEKGADIAAAITSDHDSNQLDLLRVIELALVHGQLGPDSMPELDAQLLAMYPTADSRANRELVRLLVGLEVDGAADKFALELTKADVPMTEKLHIGAYAARLTRGWTAPAKLKLLAFYEQARTIEGGYSVDKYVENFSRDFLVQLSLDEKRQILAGGERWPATALSVLAKLPEDPSPALLAEIRQLDRRVAPKCGESNAFRRLRVGILAVLGATTDAESQEYLRTIYQNEPEARDPIAMSLTQHPQGANWSILVDSLRAVDEPAAQAVLAALTTVPQRPKEAAPYRHVILLALKLGDRGAQDAIRLLNYWNGSTKDSDVRPSNSNWRMEIANWQEWYSGRFPDATPAELPVDAAQNKWSYDELVAFVDSDAGKQGDAARGRQVFATAQCAACHRHGAAGETVGPDLSTVARRFQRKEILESVFYPSHVVSDQYASRMVIAGGKTYTGLVVSRGAAGVTVLLSNGQKVDVPHEDIDDVRPTTQSAMPAGLLNPLTLDQVADLFAYLASDAEAASTGVASKETEAPR